MDPINTGEARFRCPVAPKHTKCRVCVPRPLYSLVPLSPLPGFPQHYSDELAHRSACFFLYYRTSSVLSPARLTTNATRKKKGTRSSVSRKTRYRSSSTARRLSPTSVGHTASSSRFLGSGPPGRGLGYFRPPRWRHPLPKERPLWLGRRRRRSPRSLFERLGSRTAGGTPCFFEPCAGEAMDLWLQSGVFFMCGG